MTCDDSHSRRRQSSEIRAAVALACGAVIGGVAYLNAWKESPGHWRLFADHNFAIEQMREIERYVSDYRQEHSKLPDDLSELRPRLDSGRIAEFDANDRPLDPWGHPYVYQLIHEGYRLLSYGRDGAPGGVTLDADFSTDSPRHHQPPGSATFRQFTFELPTGPLQLGCLLAGASTAVAMWVLMKKTAADGLLVRLVAWGITLLSAFFGAMLIASLHVASRH